VKCFVMELLWNFKFTTFVKFLGIGTLTRVKKGPLLKSISSTNKRKGL
jgi:hypothetical protein